MKRERIPNFIKLQCKVYTCSPESKQGGEVESQGETQQGNKTLTSTPESTHRPKSLLEAHAEAYDRVMSGRRLKQREGEGNLCASIYTSLPLAPLPILSVALPSLGDPFTGINNIYSSMTDSSSSSASVTLHVFSTTTVVFTANVFC